MGTVTPLNLLLPDAEKLLREIAQDSKRVLFSEHAKQRMRAHRLTDIQVIRCLQRGNITEGPFRNDKGNWQVRVETFSAGDPVAVVAAFEFDRSGSFIVVITTYLTR